MLWFGWKMYNIAAVELRLGRIVFSFEIRYQPSALLRTHVGIRYQLLVY